MLSGWLPRVAGSVQIAEDGKRYSVAVIIAMIILGLLLLLPLLVGLVFWMFAAAYYAGAERRKLVVAVENDSEYTVTFDGEIGKGLATAFLTKLQARAGRGAGNLLGDEEGARAHDTSTKGEGAYAIRGSSEVGAKCARARYT